MDNAKIREYFKLERIRLGLSQGDVASRACVSRELVSRFEHGQDISVSRLIRFAEAIGCEIQMRPASGRPVLEELDSLFAED